MTKQSFKVREAVYATVTHEIKEYTYDDIFEIWDKEDDSALVVVLAKRCQEYEAKIEELEKKLAEIDVIYVNALPKWKPYINVALREDIEDE